MAAKKKGKMNTKKNSKAAMKKGANNNVDVTSTEHIPKLVDLLKKNKVVIVLIWADYCGHCHTYKDQVWNKLQKNQGRKAGLASIHYDQLENTPPEIPKKVPGYPTVLLMKDGVPMKFKDKNTGDTTVEYPNSRDVSEMTNISEEPERYLTGESDDTPNLSRNSEITASYTNSDDVLKSVNEDTAPRNSKLVTPNPANDMLNSQRENRPLSVEEDTMDSGDIIAESKKGGGSLYKALLDVITPKTQTRSARPRRVKQTRRVGR
jgi:thiol-disulfide isomerase/thioredoxin